MRLPSLPGLLALLALGAACARGANAPNLPPPRDGGTTPDELPTVPPDAPSDAPAEHAPLDGNPPDADPPDGPQDLDAPPGDTSPPADLRPTGDRTPADVAPRDTGPACVCPPLPTSCAAPTPDTPAFSPRDDALARQLFALLACARTSLHAALHETSWNCIVDALAARLAAAPELTLDLVVEDSTCPRSGGRFTCALARLDGMPRVTIVTDDRSGLMHHKFILADGTRAWVASANMTQQSFCSDANNAIVVEEPAIVAAYELEFQRMFRDRQFGPIEATPPTTAGRFSLYFSPRSPATSPARWFTDMIAAVGSARSSVEFVISAFTRTEVSDALAAARGRGVDVRGVVAALYAMDAPARNLVAAGVPLRVGEVHSKLMIIDGALVVTGSPNWSANAWSNNENSLWIRDATVAAAYRADFERIYATARRP